MPYPHFPLKLYGREDRTQEILKSFSLVREQKTPRLLMISGNSGVGKSAIVSDVLQRFIKENARCISGKGDRFQQNVPSFIVVNALKQLIQQLQNDVRRHQWREKLSAALGINAQVIVDVVPELELIIGSQPPVSELESVEAENRFNFVFQEFMRVFYSQEHPLVIFLDDLQWADQASLKLVELMMVDKECCLLLIGAYRDNEVSPTHPLLTTLNRLENMGINIHYMYLESLSNTQANQFVSDTLQDWVGSSRHLFDLTDNRKPLYMKQLLVTLYIEKQLVENTGDRIWRWQFEHLQQQDVTELVAYNLVKLSPQTQHLLKRAACIGGRVSLKILADISETSIAEILKQLEDALAIQLIALSRDASNPTLEFTHDRIQQAIYDSIPTDIRAAMHLATGKLFQANSDTAHEQENLFTLVFQLSLGSCLLSQIEKDELATLNIKAARQGKLATAFESALNYTREALRLSGDAWKRNYTLALVLYKEAIEVEYLNCNFEQSQSLCKVALKQAKTLLEKVDIYSLQIKAYMSQKQLKQAVNTGESVLQMLGMELEQEEPKNLRVEELEKLSVIIDPYKLAALNILATISDAAFLLNPILVPQIIFTEVSICAQYGNSYLAAVAYTDYAFLLCTSGKIDLAYQYSKFALKLLIKFNTKTISAKVINIINSTIKHWKEHLRETLNPLSDAIQLGIENGDLEFSGYSALSYCTHTFCLGYRLQDVELNYIDYANLLSKLKLKLHIFISNILHQVVFNLLGKSSEAKQLSGFIFNEAELLSNFQRDSNFDCLFLTYLAKAILFYLFKDYGQCIESLEEAGKYEFAVPGFFVVTIYNYLQSLALLAIYSNVLPQEQKEILAKVVENQKKLNTWAYYAPMNHQHKHDMVAAVLAWVTGEQEGAERLFQQAIKGAKENGYLQEEALANELAGSYYLERNKPNIGKIHIREAYNLYGQWGAIAKTEDLEDRYQFLREADIPIRRLIEEFSLSPIVRDLLSEEGIHAEFDGETLTINTPSEGLAILIQMHLFLQVEEMHLYEYKITIRFKAS